MSISKNKYRCKTLMIWVNGKEERVAREGDTGVGRKWGGGTVDREPARVSNHGRLGRYEALLGPSLGVVRK